MTLPSNEELAQAWKDADADQERGSHQITLLALLIDDDRYVEGVNRMARVYVAAMHLEPTPETMRVLVNLITGTVGTGLGYGLRIAERRIAQATKP